MSEYQLPDLPYAYDALEPLLPREILELHHGRHHAAYVKGANETLAKLEDARRSNQLNTIPQLEKSFAFHLSGHVLHSLLWTNLAPKAGGAPSGELGTAIDRDFGSFTGFKAQLTAAASTLQGSGWGALSFEPLGARLIVQQIYDHQSNVGTGTVPLLVIDMWEHAYYLRYKNRKSEWIDAFWELVNWADVEARFASAPRSTAHVEPRRVAARTASAR